MMQSNVPPPLSFAFARLVRRVLEATRFTALAITLAVATALSITPAMAQDGVVANPPESYPVIDANGVNLATGSFHFSGPAVSIGDGALSFAMRWSGSVLRDSSQAWIQFGTDYTAYVSIGGVSDTFTGTMEGEVFTYTPTGSSQATLVANAPAGYVYTTADGTIFEFEQPVLNSIPLDEAGARLKRVTTPAGIITDYHYKSQFSSGETGLMLNGSRVQSITNNLGYQIHLDYLSDTADGATGYRDAHTLARATAINNAVDYCDPLADACTGLTEDWPTLTFAYQDGQYERTITITDALDRSVTVNSVYFSDFFNEWDSPYRAQEIERAESGDAPITITRVGSGAVGNAVATISNGAGTWTYSYVTNADDRITQTTIDPPQGGNVVIAFGNADFQQPTSVRNGAGETTSYTYDADGRVASITYPEGNSVELTYDSRGNLTETRANANSGSGLSDIVTSAAYPSSCSNPVTCNRPTSTTDARGEVTNYVWSQTHGGLLNATAPAPSTGADRPQTRNSYAHQYARYKNSSGTIVNAPSQVYRLTRTESCATGTSCDGAANETESVLNYGAGTSAATNLLLAQNITRAGNSSVSAVTRYSYDAFGNLEVFDGPVSDDDITYFYNAGIQLAGLIGMDPDGGSAQARSAIRYDYDDNGNATNVESGTASAATRAALNAMTVIQSQIFDYDSIGRRITARQRSALNVTQARVDYQYDTASRLTC